MVYDKGSKTQLAANFHSSEFDCKGGSCCQSTKVSKQLVSYLQLIRNHFGVPVKINSGYRCSTHNSAVGGSKNSKHTLGQAADIVVSGVEPKEVAKYAESIGVLGIGLYDNFVHIDTRTTKYFWYGYGEESRTTFGGATTKQELPTQEQTLIKGWQDAAIADGYKFPKYGADGKWGNECAQVAKSAVLKVKANNTNTNLIKLAQDLLQIPTTGIYDYQTEAAVKQYQKFKGIKAEGIIGINTWKALLD